MRRQLWTAVLSIVSIAGWAGWTASIAAEDVTPGLEGIPAVVAEVNGHPISREDLVRELAGRSGQAALGRLIRRTLVEQEAEAAHVKVTDDEIEAQYKIDTRDLMKELINIPWNGKDNSKPFPMADIIRARFRMSVDEYKKLVIRQKLIIRRCVAKDLHPTQAELRKFFEDYREFFFQPLVRYHACHILISPLDPRDVNRGFQFQTSNGQMDREKSERLKKIELYRDYHVDLSNAPSVDDLAPEWAKARSLAEKVLQDIKSGIITWDQALKKYTQDPMDVVRKDRKTGADLPSERSRSLVQPPVPPGDVGWFHCDGPLVKDFYEGAKNLAPGEIGGPVKTEYGFHLIKMLAVDRPPPMTFEQCGAKVEEVFIEHTIQLRLMPEDLTEVGWIDQLYANAQIKMEPVSIWPPMKTAVRIDGPVAVEADKTDPDPVIANVNTAVIRRSDVWRELVRYESDDALNRLTNREVVLNMLKPMGIARMDWECGRPDLKRQVPAPPPSPIQIKPEVVDEELTGDRLRWDLLNNDRQHLPTPLPELTFKDYIFQQYGQSVDEYKRSLEAGLILLEAVRKKVVVDTETLRVQFAISRPDYAVPAWYDISHIMIVPTGGMQKSDKSAKLSALTIADQLWRQCVNNPELFDQFVPLHSQDEKTKSRGGNLGACLSDGRRDPNQLRNAVDVISSEDAKLIYDAISKGKVARGQFILVKTMSAYHVVRVDTVHPERQVDFEEVLGRLQRDFLTERAKMYSDIWLRELNIQARVKRFIGTAQNEAPKGEVPDKFPLPKD